MKKWTRFEYSTTVVGPNGIPREMAEHECMATNSRFTVTITENDSGVTWLSFKNRDRTARHDWRDIQRMKNEIVGPEREALELYPAESRLHDSADQFHLWVMPIDKPIYIGFDERFVSEFRPDGTGSQRKFELKPNDLMTEEEAKTKSKYVKWFVPGKEGDDDAG